MAGIWNALLNNLNFGYILISVWFVSTMYAGSFCMSFDNVQFIIDECLMFIILFYGYTEKDEI